MYECEMNLVSIVEDIESGHTSVVRGMDRRAGGPMDKVKPVYPLSILLKPGV